MLICENEPMGDERMVDNFCVNEESMINDFDQVQRIIVE